MTETGMWAVIPTVLVGGPLAVLAMLFPAAFGGWTRWRALLLTAGTNATLLTLQWWFADRLAGWWATPQALWSAMGVVSVAGAVWAWQRHGRRVCLGEAPLLAGRREALVLLLVSAVGAATLVACKHLQQPLLSPAWLPVVVLTLGVWGGAAYVGWTWLRGARLVPAVATEAAVLTGVAVATAALAPSLSPVGRAGGLVAGEPSNKLTLDLVWGFRLPAKGAIASSPVVVGDRVLIAASIDNVLQPHGALYCLDRATGDTIWSFDDGRKMKPAFSTPTVAEGKIYIGEGFHQDYDCKVYCLDLRDGKKLWERRTASHTESTAAVADGRVFIGAGDDGLYCLSAGDGGTLWKLPGFHFDAGPVVAGGRVFAGCGVGDVYKTTAVFCLDSATGKPRWRFATPYSVWGRAVVSGGFVYVGSGNGRLITPADEPAGEVLCLRERDGEPAWRKRLPDAVLGRPGVDRGRLYFGCRDGWFYGVRRSDGETAWRRDLGSPLVAGPALESCPACERADGRVYVASLTGTLACLETATGRVVWSESLVERTRVPIELVATPALDVRGASRRLYVGLTLISAGRAGELLCFEERSAE